MSGDFLANPHCAGPAPDVGIDPALHVHVGEFPNKGNKPVDT